MPADNQASDRARDKSLEDTFPASDPPARSEISGAEPPGKPPEHRDIEEVPTGLPTSDRHATETAHQWEHEEKPGGS